MRFKMKIYFAAPLFSSAEKKYNQSLTSEIESLGFDVFLPQRDGVDRQRSLYNLMTDEERREAMFFLDRDQIFKSDIFLYILDGRVPDEGAAVELGMAYTNKILKNKEHIILGLHTDSRAAFLRAKLNPMLKMSFDEILGTETELLNFLKDVLAKS